MNEIQHTQPTTIAAHAIPRSYLARRSHETQTLVQHQEQVARIRNQELDRRFISLGVAGLGIGILLIAIGGLVAAFSQPKEVERIIEMHPIATPTPQQVPSMPQCTSGCFQIGGN